MPRKPPPPGDYRYAVGDLIKGRRVARGLRQRELANQLAVAFNTLAQWEQGYTQPDLETIARLARLHGMSLSQYLSPLDRVAPKEREAVHRDTQRVRTRRTSKNADELH